jgi:hypothetical protein
MPRRKRHSKRREELDRLAVMNLNVLMGVGPDGGYHDIESGSHDRCEEEAKQMAGQWFEYREILLKYEDESREFDAFYGREPPSKDHWAIEVLENGNLPPWEPDPRFVNEDPVQTPYREHQEWLADVARDEYRRLKESKVRAPMNGGD